MTTRLRCVRPGRLTVRRRRRLQVVRTWCACFISKRNISIHLRGRVRHRVGELTENESAHEKADHSPMWEGTMTHESQSSFTVPDAQPKGTEGCPPIDGNMSTCDNSRVHSRVGTATGVLYNLHLVPHQVEDVYGGDPESEFGTTT